MKTKYSCFIYILALLFAGCEKTTLPDLEISKSKVTTNELKSSFKIDIKSNSSWSVSNSPDWCVPDKTKGEGSDQITFSVSGNSDLSPRKAEIEIITRDNSQIIQISQDGAATYNLPVIFHVLYKNKADAKQYVNQRRLSNILQVVNKLYKDKAKSVDMNLTFALASSDPSGKTLASPGVEYVQWAETYPINCDNFMQDESGKYVKYLWDPNKYINVMIYNFAEDAGSNTTTLGIAHIPFTTTGSHSLEGLNETTSSSLSLSNLKFPYCASINSLFIDEQSSSTRYSTADVTVTLAHELGHYLGLYHAFYEAEKGDPANGCKDTDYCQDTPSYNKEAYDVDYAWATAGNVAEDKLFPYLVKRTNCSDAEFTSRNIMDYAVSYSDQFTQDQRDRIRHVLTYSPLIPGPKKGQAGTRTAIEGPLDLPIRTIK